ncbi:LapD/MoxY N-terminal periplasmic domain-containing protein [Citrobacter sp. RHB25-C09]|uniref:bifunctional diguanylate cyclase/phosphodiesterase n=1 Tax=Citrobacter sp. RHB25-C09 TaxID=2742624 RepID=UPI0015EE787F|nr:LapD/MoxY N-terminal periplasmic domain-containing protein [Citrobacter sp. RHB25-C09]QMI05778.1 EAL domain-containing protein [Citrobacter sp. RHB25-C09]
MSLYKQLLLGICLFTLTLLCGNYFITLESSREQYSNQLSSHAQDAATALGVALTGHTNDPAMTELMVDSIFDSGYFESIRLIDVKNGEPLIERKGAPQNSSVPQWFVHLVKLRPGVGDAIVMDGWIQAARVEVVSHPMFALTRLWDSMIASLLWLGLCSSISILCAMFMLHRSLRPLNHVVEQALSICRREFRKVTDMPKTPELMRVVEASNMMVTQLKALFHEQAERAESLREAAYRDSLTQLNNRRAFDIKLEALVTDEENKTGNLILLRVKDLMGLNQRIGGAKTDELLKSIANILRDIQARFLPNDGFLARVRGSEFALLTGELLPPELEQTLVAKLKSFSDIGFGDDTAIAHFAHVIFRRGDAPQAILSQADNALAAAESDKRYSTNPQIYENSYGEESQHQWLIKLENVLKTESFILFAQPVFSCSEPERILHYKILARIKEDNGEITPAGRFMPWIHQFSLNCRMDLVIIKQILREKIKNSYPLALSISGETVATDENLNAILHLLKNSPKQASRLTFELDENELPDAERVSYVVKKLKEVGCRLGIQHFGGRFNLVGNLPQWGLAWIKVDGAYIHLIDIEEDKRMFIEAMYWATRQIDLPLIAERVETSGELAILNKIGLYGAMGRYLGEPGLLSEQ